MSGQKLITECKKTNVNAEEINELLKNGTNVNYQDIDKKNTGLHYLCMAENINEQAISLLLANDKIRLDIKNNLGYTAFHILCNRDNIEVPVFKLFLAKENIDLDHAGKWGNRPLHFLCQKEKINEPACTLLLEKKAAINMKNSIGRTAFHYLCLQDTINMSMIKLFLVNDANFNIKDTERKKTPFEIILDHCKSKNDYKTAIDFLYCIPANRDNTITLIVDDIDQQNALKKQKIPVNFREYYKVQSEEMRNSVFGFYCNMHRLKKTTQLAVPKPVLGMIAEQACFFHKIIVNNSKGEQQQLIHTHNTQSFNPTKK